MSRSIRVWSYYYTSIESDQIKIRPVSLQWYFFSRLCFEHEKNEINSDEQLLGVEANIFVQIPFEIFIIIFVTNVEEH